MKRMAFCLLMLFISQTVVAQIEEQVDVGIMEVWVKVTDRRGQAITDLNAEEFQLYIDDEKVDLRCFDKTFTNEPSRSTDTTGRKFVFFFDLFNTLPGDLEFLKSNITQFIQESFNSNDQGMVFVLLPSAHLGIVQKLTSNRESLVSVIRKMKGNISLRTTLENNEKQLMDLLYPVDTTRTGNPGQKRGVGQRPNDTFHTAQGMARDFAAQEENRSRFTLNSFVSIGSYLSSHSLEGAVALIYVSGGFPVRPGEQYFDLLQQTIEERFAEGNADFAMPDRPRMDIDHDLKRTIGQLNRMNVTIYSLDAKGLLMGGSGAEKNVHRAGGINTLSRNHQLQDSLVLIADETGGVAFVNGQNYRQNLASIVRDMNEQYLICGNLRRSTNKSAYHEIKVKVSRPGANVRHRKGYVG